MGYLDTNLYISNKVKIIDFNIIETENASFNIQVTVLHVYACKYNTWLIFFT